MLVLQKEVSSINQNCASMDEFNALKNDLENIKTASIVNNFEMTNVNTLRRDGSKMMDSVNNYDSGPLGLLHIPDSVEAPTVSEAGSVTRPVAKPGIGTSGAQPTNRDINGTPVDKIHMDLMGVDDEAGNSVAIPLQCKSFAQLASEEGEWKDKQPSDEWKMVQRKRYRNRLETSSGEARR
ncbi:Uncharacterized protein OBRU01_18059 [Operophtera brumata]|uniref:Uncharacterized protein n=1 Tax=Operophtera brumata TaxID=104452 RepID=A0A0L7KZP6_OPEBR|nr:Uncharacterized protein OBRU01_18059 [Operophtera brumata]